MDDDYDLTTFFQTTLDHIQQLPSLRRISRNKLTRFATDISLIALGVRSGCLFDAFSPKDLLKTFSEALMKLRTTILAFEHVVLIHDPTSDHIFFVHGPLLATRLRDEFGIGSEGLQRDKWTVFVVLESTPIMLPDSQPDMLRGTLTSIANELSKPALPITISLPCHMEIKDIIPLAAVLIEYPVAYVPTSNTQTSFLSGVDLEVFKCTLVPTQKPPNAVEPHLLLKFSCPHTLVHTVSPNLEEALSMRFNGRLTSLRLQAKVEVLSYREVLDRVAL